MLQALSFGDTIHEQSQVHVGVATSNTTHVRLLPLTRLHVKDPINVFEFYMCANDKMRATDYGAGQKNTRTLCRGAHREKMTV